MGSYPILPEDQAQLEAYLAEERARKQAERRRTLLAAGIVDEAELAAEGLGGSAPGPVSGAGTLPAGPVSDTAPAGPAAATPPGLPSPPDTSEPADSVAGIPLSVVALLSPEQVAALPAAQRTAVQAWYQQRAAALAGLPAATAAGSPPRGTGAQPPAATAPAAAAPAAAPVAPAGEKPLDEDLRAAEVLQRVNRQLLADESPLVVAPPQGRGCVGGMIRRVDDLLHALFGRRDTW